MPIWTDAYWVETSHLTDAEHGRYLLMLFQMWRAPMQRFPNDDAWLARKFNRSLEVFVSEWKPLMHEFMQTDGNWWTQRRLAREFAYVSGQREKQRARAKGRWEKEKDPCRGNAQNRVLCNAPTPTPTPSKVYSSKPPSGDFDDFWNCCPRKVGKGAAKKAYARALLKTAPETLLAAIKRYAATRAGEPEQFTVHPATWLNAERWLDEGATGNDPNVSQDEIDLAADKADRYFKRGKYATIMALGEIE